MRTSFFIVVFMMSAACKNIGGGNNETKAQNSASKSIKLSELSSAAHVLIQVESALPAKANEKVLLESNGALFQLDENHAGIIIPAKNFFQPSPKPGIGYVPFVKSISLQVYTNKLNEPLMELKNLSFNSQVEIGEGLKLFGVGFGLDIQTNSPTLVAIQKALGAEIQRQVERYFVKAPLLHNNVDLRNNHTSFILLAIPKSINPKFLQIKLPTILSAENRPATVAISDSLKKGGRLVLESFRKGSGTLSVKAVPLNSRANQTALSQFLAGNTQISKELWEVSLEDKPDGDHYGDALLWQESPASNPVLLGYAVKAEVANGLTQALVVSPTALHINSLKN